MAAALAATRKKDNLRILLSGASGFIGKPLISFLQAQGHVVVPLVRGEEPHLAQFEGFDAAVNLAGESIFRLRWSKAKKEKILDSRVRTAHFLSAMFARTKRPPKVFLSASAVGYYGDRGEEEIDENSSRGKGFLSDVCAKWEGASDELKQMGVRVVHPRFGIVLGKGGGALQKMLLPYRLGLGSTLGDGRQWMSWIALEDALAAIAFALTHPHLEGPFIAASPHPVRQREFSKTLAHLLHRPAFFRWPAWLLHLISGEAADELLLSSVKAVPRKLLDEGFHFACPSLDRALRAALY